MKVAEVLLGSLIAPAPTVRAARRDYPILSMTMHSGLVDQSSKFKKRVASADTSGYKVVPRNALVVGFPIDEGVLSIQDLYDEAIVSPAYDIWSIMADNAVVPAYLERFLRSPMALSYYRAKLRGTTARRRTIPDDVFLRLPVPLPLPAQQRRIAAILDQADTLCAKRREALARLDELTQAIFLEMFGDPAMNPKGWERKRILDIATVLTGNTPPRAVKDYYGSDIEWIKSDNINTPEYYLTPAEEGLSALGRGVARVLPAGAILVTCIAGSMDCIGNAAMTDREVAFNQQINGIIPTCGNSHFIYAQLRVGKKLIQRASTNGMKGIVSKSRFEQVELIWPPESLQQSFADQVLSVKDLADTQRASLSKFDSLFASLQHRAFRAEL